LRREIQYFQKSLFRCCSLLVWAKSRSKTHSGSIISPCDHELRIVKSMKICVPYHICMIGLRTTSHSFFRFQAEFPSPQIM
jgi:hypothetical protein